MDTRATELHGLGAKLRYTRRVKKLRLKDVARRIGCSESLLSKIELDRINPSFQTLHKLAEALGTSVAALFSETRNLEVAVYRQGERPTLVLESPEPKKTQTRLERMIPYTDGRMLNANLHIVPPGGGSHGTIAHAGEEVGYVISGYVKLVIDGKEVLLSEGSSFFFDSTLPHSYVNIGTQEARILWVNTPPY